MVVFSAHAGTEPSGGAQSTWGRWLVSVAQLTPIRIAIAYATFGFFALFLSDILLVRYYSEPLLGRLQLLKGGAEVAVTAGLIYVLTNTREGQYERARSRLNHHHQELMVLYRVLRHNLRNDITAIRGYAELVRSQDPPETAATRAKKSSKRQRTSSSTRKRLNKSSGFTMKV